MTRNMMRGYIHTTVVQLDKNKSRSWVGNTTKFGVGVYPNALIEGEGSAYVTLIDETNSPRYITPEAALELAFGLFDIVEKVKPSLIQKAEGA